MQKYLIRCAILGLTLYGMAGTARAQLPTTIYTPPPPAVAVPPYQAGDDVLVMRGGVAYRVGDISEFVQNITATGGNTPIRLADRFGDTLTPDDFGAKGDGSTDDTAAFAAAFTASNELVLSPKNYFIGQTTTLVPNGKRLIFRSGSMITVANSKVVTMRGIVDAPGNAHIFQGAGKVLGLRYATPFWFGAVADFNGSTGTDNAASINAAVECVEASYNSDGGRPTLDFGAGNFGIGAQIQLHPSNSACVHYKGAGTVLRGTTITTLPSFAGNGSVIFVRGQTGTSNQLVDWCMSGIAIENGGGSATIGLQLCQSGETLNGWHENPIQDVKIGEFAIGIQAQNIRLLNFERVSIFNQNVINSVSIKIIANAGDFTGDMDLSKLNIQPHPTSGIGILIEANGAGANVSGLRIKGDIYSGLNGLQINYTGGGIIDDVWFLKGTQFQGGCAGQMIKINGSGADSSNNPSKLTDIHFSIWTELQTLTEIININSDGTAVEFGIMFTDCWYGNAAKQIAIINGGNNITFNGGTIYDTYNNTGNCFEITNGNGCRVVNIDTQRPSGSPGYYQHLILLSGASDHFVYGGNILNGIAAAGELSNATSPSASHIGQVPSAT